MTSRTWETTVYSNPRRSRWLTVRLAKVGLARTRRPASTRTGSVTVGSQYEPSCWISTDWVTWATGSFGASWPAGGPGSGPWKGTRPARGSREAAKSVPSKRS